MLSMPRKIARYDEKKGCQIIADPGIVRNRLKVAATIQNAKAFLEVQKEFGKLRTNTSGNLWDIRPLQNARKSMKRSPRENCGIQCMSKPPQSGV